MAKKFTPVEKICPIDNKPFTTTHWRQVYCSPVCAGTAIAMRQAAVKADPKPPKEETEEQKDKREALELVRETHAAWRSAVDARRAVLAKYGEEDETEKSEDENEENQQEDISISLPTDTDELIAEAQALAAAGL